MKRKIVPPEVEAFRDRLEKLTPREREVMCLTDQGHFAQAIADHLDISEDRVNKIIGQARRKLNGMQKAKAAHLVALHAAGLPESSTPTQSVGDQSLCVPLSKETCPSADADDGDETRITAEPLTEREEGFPPSRRSFRARDWAPIRLGRGQRNELSTSYTLVVIATMTTAALLTAGGAASLLTALDGLLRR